MFSKIFQFSLFPCLEDAFVLLTFQFQVYSTLGKQLSFFARKSVVLPFHPQANVRCRCASYMYNSHVRRAKASRQWLCATTALVRCREDDSKNPDMCWYKRGFLNFFFVKADVLFWKRSFFVYLEESVRVQSFVPSSLRHRCQSWRLMFLKSVNCLPDYPTLKNDSHEAWKCSVTRKKYFERPHTAVFRRQRLGTIKLTPSTQIFKQDDRFGAKRHRLLLWSVREHLIRVVQRSAFVSTDKLWLSRLEEIYTTRCTITTRWFL